MNTVLTILLAFVLVPALGTLAAYMSLRAFLRRFFTTKHTKNTKRELQTGGRSVPAPVLHQAHFVSFVPFVVLFLFAAVAVNAAAPADCSPSGVGGMAFGAAATLYPSALIADVPTPSNAELGIWLACGYVVLCIVAKGREVFFPSKIPQPPFEMKNHREAASAEAFGRHVTKNEERLSEIWEKLNLLAREVSDLNARGEVRAEQLNRVESMLHDLSTKGVRPR